MSSHHQSEPSSAASTPRSEHNLPPPPHRWHWLHLHHQDLGAAEEEEEPTGPRARLMCSFGGRIVPRPHDHQLRYVGGETRIVAIPRATSFAALLAKLTKLLGAPCGGEDLQIKYQLPNEDMDALISVTSDEDVEIMMEEYERLAALGVGAAARTPRLRLFLFPDGEGSASFGSLHDVDDGGSRRDRWFLDALNSGVGASPLERGRSEASSVVSEVPDYLFGLDSNLDERDDKSLDRAVFPELPVHRRAFKPSEPERPMPTLPPPVKIKPADPPTPSPEINRKMTVEEPVQQATMAGYSTSPGWQYMTDPVPVYLVPASTPQQQGGPIPIPLHMSYGLQPAHHGPVPVVYQQLAQGFSNNPVHAGPVYVGGVPVGRSGPVGPYGLPVSVPDGYLPGVVDGGAYAVSGHGLVVPVNPTARIPSAGELPDTLSKVEENII